MTRKILIITALAFLTLFTVTCSDSGNTGKKASITMDFSGPEITKSLTPVSTVQKASGDISVLPTDIETIEIKVTSGTEVVFIEAFDRDVIANSADSITLDIPVGTALTFTVSGYDAGAALRYSGTFGPTDLLAGIDRSIDITLSAVNVLQDADFNLSLFKEDGTTVYSDPDYLRDTDTIVTHVYKPHYDAATDEYVLGDGLPLPTEISSTISTVNVANVFVRTYQLVIVKAYADDNTIAAIGSVVIANLNSGDNGTIPVRMVPPGRINIINDSPITAYEVMMDFGAGMVTVASGSSVGANSVIVTVPNGRNNIGKLGSTVDGITVATTLRDVQITVNGITSPVFTNASIKWKLIDVTYPGWSWNEH